MAEDNEARLKLAAQYWSGQQYRVSRTRWWESNLVVSHINRNYCGKLVCGTEGGDIELLSQINRGTRFERAISVGCGNAYHEIRLLQAGVVGAFDLFEISEPRAAEARHKAAIAEVSSRANISATDPLSAPIRYHYDLVYWKDALHHMLDVSSAIRWSFNVLAPNGVFFANEFVGPTMMQYTDRQLDLAERARAALPKQYLINPHRRNELVPLRRSRPDPDLIMQIDPSECADSSNILPTIGKVFPEGVIIPTGGVVYALALSDILANFDELRDEALLRAMMLADDLCIEAGETLYAVAYGRKARG